MTERNSWVDPNTGENLDSSGPLPDDRDETIRRLQTELADRDKSIPDTFYAGLPSLERLKMLVSHWQRAVTVNQELETELAEAKQRAEQAQAKCALLVECGKVLLDVLSDAPLESYEAIDAHVHGRLSTAFHNLGKLLLQDNPGQPILDELGRLRALKSYAYHTPDCPLFVPTTMTITGPNKSCLCGFDAALAACEKEK